MRFIKKRFGFFVLALCFFAAPAFAVTFLGKAPAGVQELKDYNYPVSLYVPENYDPAKIYPMLIALPDIGEGPAKHLEEWLPAAKKKNLIVLVPSLEIRITETPFQTDHWLIRLKNDMTKRYRVDPARIFLSGKNNGAHYAAYLGIRYPDEFSAVILNGGSWAGPFEKLMQFKSSTLRQRPFLAVLDENDSALVSETEKIAYKLTQKGYPVYLKKVKKEDLSSTDQKKESLEWAFEKQQAWAVQLAESRKSLKAKTSEAVKDFFAIPQQ